MIRREFTIKWLQLVLGAVFIYSLLLVFKGSVAGSLFSWFGFGPNEAIDTSEVQVYLLLPYMVLGAVMAGWVFLMILIVRGPMKDGSLWARKFLIQSLSLWFILDTSMSMPMPPMWPKNSTAVTCKENLTLKQATLLIALS